jgi:hypothetical protein
MSLRQVTSRAVGHRGTDRRGNTGSRPALPPAALVSPPRQAVVGRGARRRAPAGLAAALAIAIAWGLLVAVAGPAAAKGPLSVAIGRVGEEPVDLAVAKGEDADQDLVQTLAEDLGVWEAMDTDATLAAEAPTDHLGPALTVVWTMYDATPGQPPDPQITQTLYPFAGGGALVHTAPGQRIFADEMVGGWFRAPERLVDSLARAGVEPDVLLPEPKPEPTPAAQTARPDPAPQERDGWGVVPTASTAALVLVGGVGAAVVAQRRRRRAVPVAS